MFSQIHFWSKISFFSYSGPSFEKKESDVNQPTNTKDSLHVPNRHITRLKTKALKKELNGLVVQVSAKAKLGDPLEH